MRKALEVAQRLNEAGVLFVPIPILDTEDRLSLLNELDRRLDMILQQVE